MSSSTSKPSEAKRRCLFFDRDGVLNEASIQGGKAYSPRTYAQFRLFPAAGGVVQAVREAGYLAIVVTNQPDIARGLMAQEELDRMHAWLRSQVPVHDILVCPHDDDDGCACRKPLPGMLIQAADRWNIDLAQSLLIGDSWKDLAAAKAAGCTAILRQRQDNCQLEADYRVDSLADLPHLVTRLNDRPEGGSPS